MPKSPKSRQKVYIEAKYGTRKDILINSSFLFAIAISVGLDVFEIKIFSLICGGTDKILMYADSALQIGLSNQLSKIKKKITQEIAENIEKLH